MDRLQVIQTEFDFQDGSAYRSKYTGDLLQYAYWPPRVHTLTRTQAALEKNEKHYAENVDRDLVDTTTLVSHPQHTIRKDDRHDDWKSTAWRRRQ